MAKLIHKGKVVLTEMKYLTSMWEISKGLMFASKKKCEKGVCMVMPTQKDVRFGSTVTMWFCFHRLEILFVNSNFEVVDKAILRPFKNSYTPIKECIYVIECFPGKLNKIKIGDKIKIVKLSTDT